MRRNVQIRTQVHKLMDASLFTLAFWLAHWVRSHYLKVEIFGGTRDIPAFTELVWLLVVIFPASPFLLEMQGFYSRPLLGSRRRMLFELAQACFVGVVLLIVVLWLTKETASARSVVVLFGCISFGLIWLKEELMRRWMQTTLGQEQVKKRVIVAGTPEDSARLKKELGNASHFSMEIMAELDLNREPIERLVDLLHAHSANAVILTAKHTYFGQIEKAIQACELEGVESWLIADFFKTQVSQTTVDNFSGRPMLVFRSTPEDSWQNLAKQIIDVLGAAILLVLLSPLFALVGFGIKITSPGPIFFRQRRSGLNGRPFTMLKFRSMVNDAEQRKQELMVFNEMSGPVFKVGSDPRITPFGRFIRKHSVDELPQLINVLRGEMSLVGPRPLPVDEVMRFDDFSHRRRLSVKPGLTCLWQVSGRSNVKDFKDWVRLDLEYIDNWSLWLDLKILARTVPVVFSGSGAK